MPVENTIKDVQLDEPRSDITMALPELLDATFVDFEIL